MVLGEGLPKDNKEALKWFRMAAEQGNAEAQRNLGRAYDNGYGVPIDDVEAVKWFLMAAEQGLAAAQANLGVMYYLGEGVPKNDIVACMWWILGSAQSNKSAMIGMDGISKEITEEQIAEAQNLSREWLAKHSERNK